MKRVARCLCVQSDQDVDCPIHGNHAKRRKLADRMASASWGKDEPIRKSKKKLPKNASLGRISAERFVKYHPLREEVVNYYAMGYDKGYAAGMKKAKSERP